MTTLREMTEKVAAGLRSAEDAGLPQLTDVEIRRPRGGVPWRVIAHVGGITSGVPALDAWCTVHAFALHAGAEVVVDGPYLSEVQPSGRQVSVRVHVVLADVAVEVLALLDGSEYAAATIPAPVRVVGPVAGLLLGAEGGVSE